MLKCLTNIELTRKIENLFVVNNLYNFPFFIIKDWKFDTSYNIYFSSFLFSIKIPKIR